MIEMNDMKCPFCQHKLQYDDLLCSCVNEHCEESFDMVGTELLWQKVIDLKQEIDGTRKALELAITGLKNCKTRDHIGAVCRTPEYVDKILEQITALEQKE